MITIGAGESKATFIDGLWTSDDASFAEACASIGANRIPSGYEPDPQLAEAEYVAKTLGGMVLEYIEDEEPDPGDVAY